MNTIQDCHHFKLSLPVGCMVFLGVFMLTASVHAGSLNPGSSASATLYTLGDIYTRLTTNATATETSHAFAPSASPVGTLYTLTQIYSAIPTITPATVLSGTTYFGVAGTYDATNLTAANVRSGVAFGAGLTGDFPSATNTLASASGTTDLAGNGTIITSSNAAVEWWDSAGTRNTATLAIPAAGSVCSSTTVNGSSGSLSFTANTVGVGTTYCGTAGTLLQNLFNGTGQSITGGTQADGGVDDGNNGGTAASGRYVGSWTTCDSGNSYCNTGGDTFADARDDSTYLIWSFPCNSSGCSGGAEGSFSTYTWSNGGANNNSRTASQLCSDRSGWSLPHQKQLQQAAINGAYQNLDSSWSRQYWSATTYAGNTANAFGVYLSGARTDQLAKTGTALIRCVRPGT